MGQGVWIDSDKLGPDDSVAEVLKHGTLSVGFIGLAETLESLDRQAPRGERGEPEAGAGNRRLYAASAWTRSREKTGLNFTLLATPAEGLQRPVRAD